MPRANLMITILFLIFIASACTDKSLPVTPTGVIELAQQLWNQPEVKPDFLQSVDVEGKNQLCAAVVQSLIWEVGNEANHLSSQIRSSSVMQIDNQSITNLDFKEVATLANMTDATGKITGSFGGPLSVCFETKGFSQGLHLVKFAFQSTSGKQYSYSWTFEVANQDGSIVIKVPKAICKFTCEAVLQ